MPGKGTEHRREVTFGHLGGSRQLGLELGLHAWGEFGHGQRQAVLQGRWAFSCKDLGLPGSQTSFLEDVAPPGGQIAGLLR